MSLSVTVWKVIAGVGTVAGVIVSLFGVQEIFDNRLKQEFAAQSEKIIYQIESKSNTLMDYQRDDLWDRIQLMETEIEGRQEASTPVPERMRIHLRSMKERYKEMKDPWEE